MHPAFDDPEVYRGVLDNLQAGVYLVDRDRKIAFWNAAAELVIIGGAALLTTIAEEPGKLPNKIAMEGHTDSKPYSAAGSYGNWELYADRANTARRLMQQQGIREILGGRVVLVR